MSAYKYYDRLEELVDTEKYYKEKEFALNALFSVSQEGDIRINETGTIEVYRNGNWEIR